MDYHRLTISGQAIVVAFDMCSSSTIIEDLTKSKNVQPLTAFFRGLRQHLAKEQKGDAPFDPYKFTGDGWLLLFPASTDGGNLLRSGARPAYLAELSGLVPRLSRVVDCSERAARSTLI